MTPESFVTSLAASVRQSANGEAEYLDAPQSNRPPAHLARFSAWFRRPPPADQDVAREVICYIAEGSLFGLLTYLDNIASLTIKGGTFELSHIAPDGNPL
jgi:hypothetical protein